MRKFAYIILCSLCAIFVGCTSLDENPYAGDVQTVSVKIVYPDGYSSFLRSGVEVYLEDVNFGNKYTTLTDDSGNAEFQVANGIYRLSVSDIASDEAMFNGMADRVQIIGANKELSLNLIFAKPGTLIIKEIYCGGCSKAPEQGAFAYDKYVVLHNNSPRTVYLDGICFGFSDPYNSNSNENVWLIKDPVTGEMKLPDFVPLLDAIWMFGGTGEDFPVKAGEDVVVVVNGAVDNTLKYPLSVNLNKSDYFVCYDESLYTNTSYHPTPGDQIQSSRYLKVAIKLGKGSGYGYSTSSPATVIFKAVDTTLEEFLKIPANVVQKPGSAVDKCALIPKEWILDGVEVFTKPSDPTKRIHPSIDAGFVVLSQTQIGHTLHRKVNEGASAALGYTMYQDTNNSSNDLYERETQSLRE